RRDRQVLLHEPHDPREAAQPALPEEAAYGDPAREAHALPEEGRALARRAQDAEREGVAHQLDVRLPPGEGLDARLRSRPDVVEDVHREEGERRRVGAPGHGPRALLGPGEEA